MKKILFNLLLICFLSNAYGQNNVGIGTPNPDPSAVLDLTATNKGFLVPRTKVALVTAPTAGLVIFDTDTSCYVLYNGSAWKNLCSPNLPPQHLGFNDTVYFGPNGTVTVVDSAGNHVLTSSQAAWLTSGNSGTTAGTNFVGTTDAQDLVVKSNNTEVLRATQAANVGIGTATPAASSILDLTSTNRGFLVPRTTVASVTTPATGLVIYDTDSNCYVMYNGTLWKNLCSPAIPPQHLAFNDSIFFNANGTVTVIDSGGNASHTTPQSAWITTGNSGTTAGVNFAGTTDPQDFVLKSNSNEVIRATTAGAVGINQPAPNATAILDINSTSKGVLFPALTTTQINAIATPAVGLTVYNTTLNVHQFWNGTCWVNVGQTVCSFDYALSQSHSTDCLFKSNFGSVADTLTVSLVTGTPSPVILSAAGVPAGVLVNFSNNYLTPTQTSIMTMTALPSAPNGTYTITILAASGSTVRTLTYTLTVYDFAVTLSPSSSTISLATAQAGGIVASSTLTIGNPSACVVNAGNAQLTYTISPSNPGLLVSFGNSTLPVPGSTNMDITSTCALAGTYQITISSQVGVSISTTVYTITINGPTPIHITTNQQNLNLYTLAGSPSCPVVDTFIVDPGVVIGSNSTANTASGAAMETGAFASGSHIVIINKGSIIGAGGTGGNDAGYDGTILGGACPNTDGTAGGTALWINTSGVTVSNLGVIGGGGGGGGAGGALGVTACTVDVRPGTGGGGGQGSGPPNGGGTGGGAYPCNPGNPGTLALPGTGGVTCQQGPCTIVFFTFGPYNAGVGGTGGTLGAAGNPGGAPNALIGGTGVCAPGNGGAGGNAIMENGNSPVVTGAAVFGNVIP